MRIAFSSDNHYDINRVDGLALVPDQATYLHAQGVTVFVNAGDTYNDFRKTQVYYAALQAELGPAVQVRYLAGNHDMVRGGDYAAIQGALDPLYLHERTLTLPDTDVVLVGNNGWYDYSLARVQPEPSDAEFARWKRAYWIDGVVEQPLSDQARMARVLATTERNLRANAGKRVIYVTHFVPQMEYLTQPEPRRAWGMVAAMLGSQALGDLLTRYGVADVVFGHMHRRDADRTIAGTRYHHRPVGYGTARRHEWRTDDFMTEWRDSLVIIDV